MCARVPEALAHTWQPHQVMAAKCCSAGAAQICTECVYDQFAAFAIHSFSRIVLISSIMKTYDA